MVRIHNIKRNGANINKFYNENGIVNKAYRMGNLIWQYFSIELPPPPVGQPDDEIWYTSVNGNVVNPRPTYNFGVTLLSNTYADGKGIMKFSGPVTKVDGEAFNGDWVGHNSFLTLDLPNSVLTVGSYCINGHYSMASITIPPNITSVGINFLSDCKNMQSITFTGINPPTAKSNLCSNTNNCPIYVPAESVNTYKTKWSNLASRIQAIP